MSDREREALRARVIDALKLQAKRHPELRIGQIIVNAIQAEDVDLFYMPDQDLLAKLYNHGRG